MRIIGKKVRPRRCSISGLVIFDSELDAKIALARRVWKDKGEKRYFSCGRHFQLTSQDRRTEHGIKVA